MNSMLTAPMWRVAIRHAVMSSSPDATKKAAREHAPQKSASMFRGFGYLVQRQSYLIHLIGMPL